MEDKIIPKKNWEFDKDVTDCFDNMLERSIPGINKMRELTLEFGSSLLSRGDRIIDLGSSRGGNIELFVEKYGTKLKYTCIEISTEMNKVLENKFYPFVKQNFLELEMIDFSKDKIKKNAKIVTSILTLQFIDIKKRQDVINNVYNCLDENGAFFLVEKVRANNYELFTEIYHDFKYSNGYSRNDILLKSNSLKNVMIPITTKENIKMLEKSGFKNIDIYWQNRNFVGIIATK